MNAVSNVIQKRATSPPEISQLIWNAGSMAGRLLPVRSHLQRECGAGRSVTPNWLEQRLPVSF